MELWKLSLILLLAALCNTQEIGENAPEVLNDPVKTNNDLSKPELSIFENITFNNKEVIAPPAENNMVESIVTLNATQTEIEQSNILNTMEDKVVEPMPLKPEYISAIPGVLPDEPETSELPEEAPTSPIISNIPEVISASGEPIPIAVVANGGVIVAPELELKPELKPENDICLKRNSYYKVDGNCDAYIECREFISRDMLCPDGMHFNPDVKWPEYPCGYSMDVSCTGRGVPQQPNPTEHCPHRYGFYPPLEIKPNECGRYRMCVDGNSVDMMCPPGLAYNPDISRCDWPENVASCDSEAFLGFKCPPYPVDTRGKPLDVVLNFRHEKDCHAFYSCKEGKARILSCDFGFAFDPAIGRCVDSELVNCPFDPKLIPKKIFF